MIQPPLYIRLTCPLTGRKDNILLGNIHVFSQHECDEEDCQANSEVITLVPNQQGVACYTGLYVETEEQIAEKMKKLVQRYIHLSITASEKARESNQSWRQDDDEDEDNQLGDGVWA